METTDPGGFLDKLIGPSGGLVLCLLGIGVLVRHHIHILQAHAEKVEAKDEEIRRLADARVVEEQARAKQARELIDRIERHQDKTDGRWAKLGQVLGRLEIMVRALAKKAGNKPPAADVGLPEDDSVSMF